MAPGHTKTPARVALGLTQAAYASMAGLSAVSVNRHEAGHQAAQGWSLAVNELILSALERHPAPVVLDAMAPCRGDVAKLARALVRLGDGR